MPGGPSVTAPQPGWALGQDPNRLSQVLGSQEAARPPPQLLSPGWFFGGGQSSETHRTSSFQNITESLLVQKPQSCSALQGLWEPRGTARFLGKMDGRLLYVHDLA